MPNSQSPTVALRSELLIICGLVALVGNIAPNIMAGISAVVTDHRFIAETVSEMGKGEMSWIMDVGFYLNAAGLIALAIGCSHLHLGERGWSFGVVSLALLALVVVLVGVWDEFHTAGDNPPGLSVHTKLTFALAPLYLAGPLLMAGGLDDRKLMRWSFIAAAVLWVVFATAFKLAPNSYDGLLEKIAISATLLWTLPLAWLLFSVGRQIEN